MSFNSQSASQILVWKRFAGLALRSLLLRSMSRGTKKHHLCISPTPICTFTSSHHGDVKFLLNDSLPPNRDVLCSEAFNGEKL